MSICLVIKVMVTLKKTDVQLVLQVCVLTTPLPVIEIPVQLFTMSCSYMFTICDLPCWLRKPGRWGSWYRRSQVDPAFVPSAALVLLARGLHQPMLIFPQLTHSLHRLSPCFSSSIPKLLI